jgi:hypothetical protein
MTSEQSGLKPQQEARQEEVHYSTETSISDL